MVTPLITIGAIIAAALACVIAPAAREIYRQYRQRQVVVCPNNKNLAEVNLQAGRAALKSLFGEPKLLVKSCSRWPSKKGCDEACVKENWPMA
ncbi:MAG TPA: hypothetical protein VNT76_21575 [Candidatus Binatus sp.]|nr:hypothetical protein [Candidatus Binatus sp.]